MVLGITKVYTTERNKLDTKYITIMVKQSFKVVGPNEELYGNIYTDDPPNYIRI